MLIKLISPHHIDLIEIPIRLNRSKNRNQIVVFLIFSHNKYLR